MARADTECPICGARLSGSRFSGYSCAKCSSHFSGRFIAQMRRREFSERIAKHFQIPVATVERSPIIEVREEITLHEDAREILDRVHMSVQDMSGMVHEVQQVVTHVPLEDIVGPAEELVQESVQKPAKTMQKPVQRPVRKPTQKAAKAAGRAAPARKQRKRSARRPARRR